MPNLSARKNNDITTRHFQSPRSHRMNFAAACHFFIYFFQIVGTFLISANIKEIIKSIMFSAKSHKQIYALIS